jgi:hypothetical protein
MTDPRHVVSTVREPLSADEKRKAEVRLEAMLLGWRA